MRLIEPSPQHLDAFLRLAEEVRDAEPDFASVAAVTRETWEAYLTRLRGLRDGSVATRAGVALSTLWLLGDGGEILGVSGLRHRLTPALREYGGHIGFAIRPSARRQGAGVEMLAQTLEYARNQGLGRALLTCDADNAGSRRIIERCGGALDAEYVASQSQTLVRRYWISLGGEGEALRP